MFLTCQAACFLDTRFKKLLWITDPEEKRVTWENLKTWFEESEEPKEPACKKQKQSNWYSEMFGFENPEDDKTEFEQYDDLPMLTSNISPLKWWQQNHSSFPTLARLAKDWLMIPTTSVPSERLFSAAGNVMTNKRNCLTPEHGNQLVFLYENSWMFDSNSNSNKQ